jgi:hypothetical protein
MVTVSVPSSGKIVNPALLYPLDGANIKQGTAVLDICIKTLSIF